MSTDLPNFVKIGQHAMTLKHVAQSGDLKNVLPFLKKESRLNTYKRPHITKPIYVNGSRRQQYSKVA
jgi:hypothetical protein